MRAITYAQTLAASKALAQLMEIKRPMMGLMRMRRLAGELAKHVADFQAQERVLFERYGAKDDEGKLKVAPATGPDGEALVSVTLADPAGFHPEYADLLAAIWECPEALLLGVTHFGPLTPDGADWLHEEQKPTPAQATALGPLLEELDIVDQAEVGAG